MSLINLIFGTCCPGPWPEPGAMVNCAFGADSGRCPMAQCPVACGTCELCAGVHSDDVFSKYTRLWKRMKKPPYAASRPFTADPGSNQTSAGPTAGARRRRQRVEHNHSSGNTAIKERRSRLRRTTITRVRAASRSCTTTKSAGRRARSRANAVGAARRAPAAAAALRSHLPNVARADWAARYLIAAHGRTYPLRYPKDRARISSRRPPPSRLPSTRPLGLQKSSQSASGPRASSHRSPRAKPST